MQKNLNFLKKKSILVTGGTGSFGKKFVSEVLKKHKIIKKIIVFSRDELKQYEMSKIYSTTKYSKLRYFIGDVRDKNRLIRALKDIDIVIHAAALKQVPTAEYNPFEYIQTNTFGAQNLIEACLDTNVENLIALSTDKAVSPINLYGATKLCADKLFTSAKNMAGNKKIKFSVVRYGNVTSSRGSVIPYFKTLKDNDYLPITHKEMTRFNISLDDAINLVMYTIKNNFGGEIFVPKLPSYKVTDLASAMFPKKKLKYIGIREGEKIHEELISKAESLMTLENEKFYIVLSKKEKKIINHFKKLNFKDVKKVFSYSSGTNPVFLNQKELKKII
jgi:UDP-N-acetylglucosamine 4,6-dehydratase